MILPETWDQITSNPLGYLEDSWNVIEDGLIEAWNDPLGTLGTLIFDKDQFMQGWNGKDENGKHIPLTNRVWKIAESLPIHTKALKVGSIGKKILIRDGCGCPTGDNLPSKSSKDEDKDSNKHLNESVKFEADFEAHIIKRDFNVPRRRGIGGTHNYEEFKKYVGSDVKILSLTEHPSVQGIYYIEYQMSKLDGKTSEIQGWRNQNGKGEPFEKTVYDPKYISNEQYLQWSREAVNDAVNKKQINGREWKGTASNGFSFIGYFNNDEEVRTAYPDWKPGKGGK